MSKQYSLSKPQKLIYDMDRYAGGSIAVLCGSLVARGQKSRQELKEAVNEIYRLNDALRLHIIETADGPKQTVSEFVRREVGILYFEKKQDLDLYAENCAKEPMDLYGSLCELRPVVLKGSYGILIKLHHIAGDAWTMAMIGSQFQMIVNGKMPEAYSYTQYLDNERDYLQSSRYAKSREFFLEQFKGCGEVTYLSDRQCHSYAAKRRTFVLDKEDAAKLTAYAKAHNTSAYAIFMTAFAAYISRSKMNAEEFYLGTAILNRSGAREKNTMGMFVNTVPILVRLENNTPFADNLSVMTKGIFEIFRHQKYHYGNILADIRQEYGVDEKLYDVLISYQNAVITGAEDEFETTWYHNGMQTESLQIHIDDRDREGIFRIHYDYQVEKYTEHEIECMYQHVMNLLFDAVENDNKRLCELEMLSLEEKKTLLYDFNDTALEYPGNMCVHTVFEKQAKKTPNQAAVIACDRTLTYRELNEQANRVAHSLIAKGVRAGDFVAFALPRESALFSTMFGILKAGAAYLPIDMECPKDRVDEILEDSGAVLFITKELLPELLANDATDNPDTDVTSENFCYCVYTSGSTGKPKGVLIRHRNLINFCRTQAGSNYQHNAVCENKRLLLTAKTCFDQFDEYALFLLNGNAVVLAADNEIMDGDKLAALAEKYEAKVISTTPSVMKALCSSKAYCNMLKQVKAINIGGERFPVELYPFLKSITDAKIINIYGPTETTIIISYGELLSEDIHIGKPIANTQIYIVDKYMNPVPTGTAGELCIAGDSVGAGYLNREELTAERFVDNPFGKGKLYKTGDIAFWRKDGTIFYIGRNDFQVKIRGLRIELGEIENNLAGIEGITQAVAVVRENNEGRQFICAFYTGEEIDSAKLRDALGRKLPEYMIPHVFKHLAEIPLTVNGKVDSRALPKVDFSGAKQSTEYEKPKGEIEKKLAEMMEKVLEYTPIGRNEHFFEELGGDSLKAIEFAAKAHNEGIYITVQSIFDYPTVRQLAEYVESGNRQSVSYDDADFTEIDRLLMQKAEADMSVPPRSEPGNILLCGATGYLGIHMLADFLEHDSGTAFCIVRGESSAESEQRLRDILAFYFGDRYANLIGSRIRVVCADLQKVNFGLPKAEYEQLYMQVDTVLNAAASVKHYGSYQYFYEKNVETVKRLINFCRQSNAKLIHTSTLSVSGNGFADNFDGNMKQKSFSEGQLYIGQPLDNVYIRSKFEAERLVLEAMTQGLRAQIMRMGNLTNRASDGAFQKNLESNAFLKRIKAFIELGKFPDYLTDYCLEFTPVDEAAAAVMAIARYADTEQKIFHINNPKVIFMDDFADCLSSLGYFVRFVGGKEFAMALRETAFFEAFIGDMDSYERLVYDRGIHVINDRTVQYLKKLGFEWSEIGQEYLRKYVEYFQRAGYFTLKA